VKSSGRGPRPPYQSEKSLEGWGGGSTAAALMWTCCPHPCSDVGKRLLCSRELNRPCTPVPGPAPLVDLCSDCDCASQSGGKVSSEKVLRSGSREPLGAMVQVNSLGFHRNQRSANVRIPSLTTCCLFWGLSDLEECSLFRFSSNLKGHPSAFDRQWPKQTL
jgi:hypothetical protein